MMGTAYENERSGPISLRATRLVSEQLLTSGFAQRIGLQCQILIGPRDTCVS
jgi:hypothetical protein